MSNYTVMIPSATPGDALSSPPFIGQPDDVSVLWGYGLRHRDHSRPRDLHSLPGYKNLAFIGQFCEHVDAPGDYVKKPMAACTAISAFAPRPRDPDRGSGNPTMLSSP